VNCRYTIAPWPTDEQPPSVARSDGSAEVSAVADVGLDDPYEPVDDSAPCPRWLWVRLPVPNRIVWERVFADEARHDGLDYRMTNAPPAAGANPAVTSIDAAPVPNPNAFMADIMTVEETAAFLRINVKTAYPKIRSGQIPGGLRIGGTVRVSKNALLEAFRRPPTSAKPRRRP